MEEKMKVVWICGFSNEQVRERLDLHIGCMTKLMWKLMRNHTAGKQSDMGVWNTNAIREIEKYTDIELHVISPCMYLKNKVQKFEISGIHYHFFRDERGQLPVAIYRQVVKPAYYKFAQNRKAVKNIINKIQPSIVHLMGAENPHYSLSLLDVPSNIPTIVQLQTLMNDPDFKANYHIDDKSYEYRSRVEREVIDRADYLGTTAKKYINIIKESIKPDANILDISLVLGVKINLAPAEKKFDFVYFARELEKAGDIALESFGIAYAKNRSITLDMVGACSQDFRQHLDKIALRYGVSHAVTYEGALQTHDAIMTQIRKSRFSILPLKIDLTSSTIRESMANGIPVLTTDTGELGTRKLNDRFRTVLLSPVDDVNDLAEKMLMLLSDKSLADELKNNAALLMQERSSNEALIKRWVEAYYACIQA